MAEISPPRLEWGVHEHHHITHPEAMHASLRRALRPGGRLAIIDFEPFPRMLGIPEGVPQNRAGHGMPLEVLLDELAGAGFELEHRIDDWFRFDYCAVWTRPGNGSIYSWSS